MQIDKKQNTTTTGVVTFSFSNAVENWRLQRMIKVYSYITSMYDSEEYFHLITRMHDHEGELTVTVCVENRDRVYVFSKLGDWKVRLM